MPTLEWIGKSKVINHHQEVPFRVLERQYSYDEQGQHEEDNGSENMIIRGDNLEALKALLPKYEGRIKRLNPYWMRIIGKPFQNGWKPNGSYASRPIGCRQSFIPQPAQIFMAVLCTKLRMVTSTNWNRI